MFDAFKYCLPLSGMSCTLCTLSTCFYVCNLLYLMHPHFVYHDSRGVCSIPASPLTLMWLIHHCGLASETVCLMCALTWSVWYSSVMRHNYTFLVDKGCPGCMLSMLGLCWQDAFVTNLDSHVLCHPLHRVHPMYIHLVYVHSSGTHPLDHIMILIYLHISSWFHTF